MFIKNQEKQNIIWKSKEICESTYLKGKVVSLLKTRFLVTLNLKEIQKIEDLKLFENLSEFKIIWKKKKKTRI